MIELFGALNFLVLIEGAIVVALLFRLDSVEDIKSTELQKLVSECID